MHTRGILVMTPDERDGAHRQAGARLLRRRLGRGQLRHRRLRPDHGPERPGAVLGARPRRRLRHPARATTSTPTSRPGERFPRRAPTHRPASTATSARRRTTRAGQPTSRPSATSSPTTTNPERKKPFDIRSVMRAVDRPGPRAARALGRRWRDAETAVVWDAHLGGYPGLRCSASSRGRCPATAPCPPTGPTQWTSGTLFPLSSKKVARAINAASGNRPRGGARQPVRLRRLAGVDAPAAARVRRRDRPRGRQLRRARSCFCVVSRYHGGAFVVFSGDAQRRHGGRSPSRARYASVIGGAPAAAVVFAREVDARTGADPRVRRARGGDRRRRRRRARRACAPSSRELREAVRSEKLGEVAAEFDAVHSVERAPDGRLGRRDHPRRRAAAVADRGGRAGHARTSERVANGHRGGMELA